MRRVECTDWWWRAGVLHKPGDTVNVPEGASVPAGFIVDGVRTPKAEKKSVKDRILEEKDMEIAALQARLAAAESDWIGGTQKPVKGKKE